MTIKFVRSLPPRGGRDTMNPDRANELLDEMLANNGLWAEVPITHLYPDIYMRTNLNKRQLKEMEL